MKIVATMAIGLLACSTAFSQSWFDFREWKGFSSPDIISSGFTHAFSDLPLEGSIKEGTKAWSGHYWPSKKAGINFRWNDSRVDNHFKYKSPTQAVVAGMSTEQLSYLSPTEKFDIYMGRYDYPLKKEAYGPTSKFASDWAGICHGWAPASLHHNEPTPKVMTSADGTQVPFGSADIKALLSYYYAFHFESKVNQVGLRCFFGRWLGGARGCKDDLNAGAFHIVIANKLGLMKEGLMMDKDRYREVWNQPIISFKSKILAHNLRPSRKAASAAAREMRIAMELFYVDEPLPVWEVAHGTENQKIGVMNLQYRIELDSEGKIVGGEWESHDRPDFLWDKGSTFTFEGLLAGLEKLLDD